MAGYAFPGPGGFPLKYGREHAPECTCDACLRDLASHEYQNGRNPCPCKDCADTRRQLDIIRETEERGRRSGNVLGNGTLKNGNTLIDGRGNVVANIVICDRPECGSMAKSGAIGVVEAHTAAAAEPRGKEKNERIAGQLCPACVAEFVAWWEGPVKNRDRAYSKSWQREETAKAQTSAELFQLALEASKREMDTAGE